MLDDAELEQVDIVGSHGGCIMALELAATHPERVKRMVLDGLPYWNRERGRIIWERFWVPRFKETTSYDVPVYALTTWEEAVQENRAYVEAEMAQLGYTPVADPANADLLVSFDYGVEFELIAVLLSPDLLQSLRNHQLKLAPYL